MKHSIYLLFFMLLLSIVELSSQCRGASHFKTQADVEEFVRKYSDCPIIEGNLVIGLYPWEWEDEVADIKDVSELSHITRIEGDLYIAKVNTLTDLSGLENVKYIGGNLEIGYTPSLRNLSALSNVDTIGGRIFIRINDSLETLANFDHLNYVGDNIRISFNRQLTSIGGFKNLKHVPNGLEIQGAPLISYLGDFENVETISGAVRFAETGIKDMRGLKNLKKIEGQFGRLWIDENPSLESLDGLENLSYIKESLSIGNAPNIKSISALQNLKKIGSSLAIFETSLVDLDGLQNAKIGTGIIVRANENLLSFKGLNLNSVINGNLMIRNNHSLKSLNTVAQIDSIYGELEIRLNPLLGDCQSICSLLHSGYIEEEISIQNNLLGCNSMEEISNLGCITASKELPSNSMTIAPNPVQDYLSLQIDHSSNTIEELSIYDMSGRMVYNLNEVNFSSHITINVKELAPGVYVLKGKHNQLFTIRFIKM